MTFQSKYHLCHTIRKKRNHELITTVEKECNQEYAKRRVVIESIPSAAG
ncbi:MAG: hypothetical protein ABJB76_11830 [Candidatus Nitrosocosmicus sp.]